MNKFLYSLVIGSALAFSYSVDVSAQVRSGTPQPKGSKTVGKSKVYPNQKTQSQVEKRMGQEIKRTQAKIRTVENRMSDFAQSLRTSPTLINEKGAQQAISKVINEHGALKQRVTRLQNTKFETYASQRGISMVPNPPRSKPPGLPQTLLPPPAKPSLKEAKAKLPPPRPK